MFFPSVQGIVANTVVGVARSHIPANIVFLYSTHHLSLAVLPVTSPDDPNLPDMKSEFISMTKIRSAMTYVLPVHAVAAFKILAPNKNKAQQRLADLKKKL